MRFSFLFILFFAFGHLAEAKTLASTTTVAVFLKAINIEVDGHLIPNGKDPHHYEMKPLDLVKVESAKALYINAKRYEDIKHQQIKKNYSQIEIHFFDEDLKAKGMDFKNPHFLSSPNILKALSEVYAKDEAAKTSFQEKIEVWKKKHKKKLAEKKVYVFHQSLDYLLKDLNITKIGQIEKHHGVFPSLADINRELKKMKAHDIRCVLVDEYVGASLRKKARKAFRGLKWQSYRGELDTNKDKDLWAWLDHLSQAIESCSAT